MTTSPKPAPPGDRLFALIASIPGSGSADWCDRVRALLDEVRAEAAPPATGPVCKFAEGCHRVVACDPGCAVTAARMYAKLAAAQSAATDQTAPSHRAGLRAEIAKALEAADYRMDMRRGDLADAVLPVLYREWPWLRAEAEDTVLPAPADRTAQDELRAEIEELVRWHREDGTALAEMRATIVRLREELAATVPVDRTAVPAAEGQPETPLEKRLRYSERRNDELREECLRRGKVKLEYAEKIQALEREIDGIQRQLGAEILRAGQAELRGLAGEAQPGPDADAIASCPGHETDPSPCCCPCEGCKHHCGAHNPAQQPARPPVHLGGRANAELCPACAAERRGLPYPFLCPAEPGAAAGVAPQPKDADNSRDVCVCGHTRSEHVTVSGRLLCDACDPADTETLTCKEFEAL